MQLLTKDMCCGCEACANSCPIKCISMEMDQEGFLYPNVDGQKCILCGKCRKSCPVINNTEEKPFQQKGYLVQHNNSRILQESTSGGAFTAIAEYVLKNNGVVFGAAFSKCWEVRHIAIENIEELYQLRNSKYVQSSIGDTYQQVLKHLKNGRFVCFSGTPCQIEGLLTFLSNDYEKLLTVDIVCHSVPSPGLWKRYVDYLTDRLQTRVQSIKFREKVYGYKYSVLVLRDNNEKIQYAEGIDTDPYMRAFFSDVSVRPSCYNCQFKKRYRKSDFTIWDCFNAYDFSKKMDNNKGTTRVLIHTDKGDEIFEEIKEQFQYVKVQPDKLVNNVHEMIQSVRMNPYRTVFFEDYSNMDVSQLFEKYYPKTMKTRLEKGIRIFCAKTGIYGVAIRLYKCIFRGARRNR